MLLDNLRDVSELVVELLPVPFWEVFKGEHLWFLEEEFHTGFEFLLIKVDVSYFAFADLYLRNPDPAVAVVHEEIEYQVWKIISRKVVKDLSLFI